MFRRKNIVQTFSTLTPPSEFDEQCSIFTWAEYAVIKHPCLEYMYSTLNGVRLTMRQAVKAKLSGNKKGVPDIVLPYPSNGFHGLYIELKREKLSSTSAEQKKYIAYLNSVGYSAHVSKGSESAIRIIEDYLKGDNHGN